MFIKKQDYEILKNLNKSLLDEKEALLSEIKNLKAELENVKKHCNYCESIILKRFNYEISITNNNVNNYYFNPCKQETWDEINPETTMMINGDKIYSEFPKQMKWQDFFEFSESLINYLSSKSPDKPISKETVRFNLLLNWLNDKSASSIIDKLQKEIDLQKEIKVQLENKSERNSKFDPYKPETWKNAQENKIVFIDDCPIYREMITKDKKNREITERTYILETKWEEEVELEKGILSDKLTLSEVAEHLCKMFKITCHITDLQPLFKINNFSFSKAKLDLISDWSYQNLCKIADTMNYCIENKLKKYQFKQELFDNHIPVDNYFFADLYFKELNACPSDIDELMTDYYHEVCIESKNPNEILDKSLYLADKPELKKLVLDSIHIINED